MCASIYIYIHVRCRVSIWSKILFFWVNLWSKFCANVWSKICFAHFSSVYCFVVGMFEFTDSAQGCQNRVFQELSGCLKWGFRKRNDMFCFFASILEKERTQKKKKQTEKTANMPLKKVFWGWVGNRWILFRQIAKHDLCLEGGKGHFRQHYLFWQDHSFLPSSTKPQNTTKLGLQPAQGKTKNCFLGVFASGLWKAVYYLWSIKAVLCWKHYFNLAFSTTPLLQEKGCKLSKDRKLAKSSGLFFNMQKVFFSLGVLLIFGLGWLVVCVCVCVSVSVCVCVYFVLRF